MLTAGKKKISEAIILVLLEYVFLTTHGYVSKLPLEKDLGFFVNPLLTILIVGFFVSVLMRTFHKKIPFAKKELLDNFVIQQRFWVAIAALNLVFQFFT